MVFCYGPSKYIYNSNKNLNRLWPGWEGAGRQLQVGRAIHSRCWNKDGPGKWVNLQIRHLQLMTVAMKWLYGQGLTPTRGTIGLRTTEVKEPRHGQDSLGILKEHECFNNWGHFKRTTATPALIPTGNVGSLKGKPACICIRQKDDFFLLDTGSSTVALNLLCCWGWS